MSQETKQIRSVTIEFPDGSTQEAQIVIPINQVEELEEKLFWKDFNQAGNKEEGE